MAEPIKITRTELNRKLLAMEDDYACMLVSLYADGEFDPAAERDYIALIQALALRRVAG